METKTRPISERKAPRQLFTPIPHTVQQTIDEDILREAQLDAAKEAAKEKRRHMKSAPKNNPDDQALPATPRSSQFRPMVRMSAQAPTIPTHAEINAAQIQQLDAMVRTMQGDTVMDDDQIATGFDSAMDLIRSADTAEELRNAWLCVAAISIMAASKEAFAIQTSEGN